MRSVLSGYGDSSERVFSPDGLNRDTLERIEQLTADES
jgi:hypothetical protein